MDRDELRAQYREIAGYHTEFAAANMLHPFGDSPLGRLVDAQVRAATRTAAAATTAALMLDGPSTMECGSSPRMDRPRVKAVA